MKLMTDDSSIIIGKLRVSKKGLTIFSAAVIPVLIMLSVFYAQGIYPFGQKTTMYVDLQGQYSEFLSSLRYTFEKDSSLLFNWSRSMGGNAVGLYAYYSGGLVGFLACLFPVSKIYAAVVLIQLVQIGFCGFTMSIYLEYGLMKNKKHLFAFILSISYALMSYNVVYLGCFMWLTGCAFMPLIMLGIERIIEGKRGLVFYVFLAIAMISNYYTAYMIVLMSFLYLIVRILGEFSWKKDKFTESFKLVGIVFAKYVSLGVLAAMTALPVILPVYRDLMRGKLTGSGGDISGVYYQFMDVFKKLFAGQYDTIKAFGGLPSIFTGIVVLALAVIFFFQIKRKISERLAAFGVVSLLLVCFCYRFPDTIWHGFQVPNSFPYRYAFVFSFFMVFLSARALDILEIKKYNIMKWLPVLLVICSIYELRFNASVITRKLDEEFIYCDKNQYEEFYNKTAPLVEQMKSSDDSWYRAEKDYEFSKNDALLLGYNGITHYSSTYNAYVNGTTSLLGLSQNWFWNTGYGLTPLVDSMFGVKYKMCKSSVDRQYEKIGENEDITLYKNPYALAPVFAANNKTREFVALDSDPFTNQNKLMSSVVGTDKEYFAHVDFERTDLEGCITLTVPNHTGKSLYMYIRPKEGESGDIFVNGIFAANYFIQDSVHPVYIGNWPVGTPVTVEVRTNNAKFDEVHIVEYDAEMMNADLLELQKGGIVLDSYGAGSLHGKINVGNDQTVVSSIPYDEGFTVKVDGNDAEIRKWEDTFLAFNADPGEHEINISYCPEGFKSGLIASLVGIFICALYMLFPILKKRLYKKDSL